MTIGPTVVYSLLSYFVITLLSSSLASSFVQQWRINNCASVVWTSKATFELLRSKSDVDEGDTEKFTSDHEMFSNLAYERDDESSKQHMMDELEWRKAKVKLEESNEKAFLKRIRSKPWKLPYDEAVRYPILVTNTRTSH